MSPHFLCWQKPLPPISSTDEERQLQLALALSKEEHEKVPEPRSPGCSSPCTWASLWGAGAPNAASLWCLLCFHCSGLSAELSPNGPGPRGAVYSDAGTFRGCAGSSCAGSVSWRRCWLPGCWAHGSCPLSPQEVRTWQGENSLMQRTMEETAPSREEEEEEDKMKKSQVQHGGTGGPHSQRWTPG